MDPWRDSPARLRAYKHRFGADFSMLTGSVHSIRKMWDWFGVQYRRVPEDSPPDIDWWTHKPEKYDVDHTDAVFIIDPHGYLRVVDDGMPELQAKLSAPLRSSWTRRACTTSSTRNCRGRPTRSPMTYST